MTRRHNPLTSASTMTRRLPSMAFKLLMSLSVNLRRICCLLVTQRLLKNAWLEAVISERQRV
jgi:hypothetical protein